MRFISGIDRQVCYVPARFILGCIEDWYCGESAEWRGLKTNKQSIVQAGMYCYQQGLLLGDFTLFPWPDEEFYFKPKGFLLMILLLF